MRRLQDLEGEVARLKLQQKSGKKGQTCKTCPRGQHPEGRCPGKRTEECYGCGKAGHFKGAPVCKGKPNADSKPERVKKVKQEEQEVTDRAQAGSQRVLQLRRTTCWTPWCRCW